MVRCLVFGIVLVWGGFQALAADAPRNLVFILADDLGWAEVGCYGQKKIPTPNIDKLARAGMRFTRHYSGAPVCAPSRCVLMTGQHLGHAEIRGNAQAKKAFPEFDEGQHPITEKAKTFPMLFQKAGFKTGAMGKWGLGPVKSSGDPSLKGFDLFFGYNCQAVAHSYFPGHLWRNQDKIPINPQPIPGHQKKPEGEIKLEDYQGEKYAPSLMIAEAEKFIADHAKNRFLLYLPFIEPHVAMQPPAELVKTFPAEWDQQPYRGGNGYLPHPRPRAAYAAMITDLDRHVGRVMAALDKAGVSDSTLVVFTSDNGATLPSNGEPAFHVGGADPKFFNSTADLRGYKGSVYEGGIRVPMIARLPGVIPAGTVNDTPCYFADWFPTLCEAFGLKPEGSLDGESFWDTLKSGKSRTRSKPMIWVFPEYTGQVAVQSGDWKVVRRGLKSKKVGDWEVYNLAKDRGETKDLAGQQPDLIAKTIQLLKKEVAENQTFPLVIPGVND
jgi:arylsulfatase A-like enzyme